MLSLDEQRQYADEWQDFKDKYKVNSTYNTHSGVPVISRVYRFANKPLFRAHVFNRRLRTYDPYSIASKCLQPFWHAQHYFIVGEQIYTASSKLAKGDVYNQMIAREVPIQFKWSKSIFWNNNISIELIMEEMGKIRNFDVQRGYFTFYSNTTGEILSRHIADSFWDHRSYVKDIISLKSGDESTVQHLIRKIEHQAIVHSSLIKPRRTLQATPEYLIDELNNGRIPEKELHDFFNLWDKD